MLDFDCSSLLGPPARCLNQQKLLNRPRMPKSVFNFLGIFQYAMAFFLQLFHVYEVRICLHIYRATELGQKLGPISIAMMIESLIGNQIFLIFHDWKMLPNLEILYL